MTRRNRTARTRLASGRFLSLLAGALTACQMVGSGPPAPEEARYPDPVLERGAIPPAQEVRAAQLYAAALEQFDAGQPATARRLADEIVGAYPRAPVSGVALFLRARAALAEGDGDAADADAGRFIEFLAPGDPRRAEARLLQAAAQAVKGDQQARLERLLLIGGDAPINDILRALENAREAAAALQASQIQDVLSRAQEGPVRAVPQTRYALLLQVDGRGEEARAQAQAALDGGARGTDSLSALAVLEGRNPLGEIAVRRLSIATVLPIGGSPAFRDFASLVAEGVEVASATVLEGVADVEVVARDDLGDPAVAAAVTRELEETDVLGAVGFLEEGALGAAATARTGPLPLVSPTARTSGSEGAYALSGPDPQAAAAMARYAAQAGFRRVAVIHSMAPESIEEADAFQNALVALGVPLAGRFSYPVGTTSYRSQILDAREVLRAAEIRSLGLGPDDTLHVELLEPVALFAPVPPEDVELLAPQIVFHGLDTLAISTLGTSGWTDAQTLEAVDDRHTTGVVATAPVGVGPGSPGQERFRRAYESYFQRSLVSPVPALGYDAALLVLEAARLGARSSGQLRSSLERLRGVEGVTGIFSVVDGRVIRRTHLVRIEHGSLIPLG
ncbi:MAG TPA: ABC transporter substrate-binding protein [Longimicrobiales bacterium]|nr:ABC transporter substrate-binding protein [Longimicrobiales bacterium]